LQFYSFNAGYVESLCAGDQLVQEHFVGYFTELLHLKLRTRLQSQQAIEDISQETFARVLSALRKDGCLREPERLGAFVNTVCNHVLFEHYRSAGRSESLDVEGRPELAAKGADALEIAAAGQIKDKVREILLNLDPHDR
jgi:RNA polymerase sigma-70 factor (ECF subfamily)